MNIQSRTEIGQDTIRVMLVDDDDRIQQALRLAIETHPELNLVGQAYTLKDAMAVVEELQPEVVLVDLGLPDGSGLELIAHIHQHMPGCESMVLTVFGDESHVISSIEAGATGYLTKDTRTADILNRLKQLRAGGSPISPVIARRLLNRFRGVATPDQLPTSKTAVNQEFTPLSEREQQVLEMVAKGFMQAEIADILGVSINTISTYIKRIYKKLAVNSRTSAVHRANALGLINLKDC
ncbi:MULTISPECIES: response regulator transcription factor [unclassified Limnobacter]|uniref:response regulator transcription factor n=1 Tax=unclassified Limnobacter TaxID=2630203 RepID=UPI000C3EE65B|nr:MULTISPECIES: response regulator transcription factor [unclassified Limnobacter]MAZ09890.1 DNA-binding response regulator [Sutterellaceae bacterium]|tara:strand:- start:14460 stop:15173 length:714 start_codon:yes stop_codon:yes gene_type:complete